MNNLSANDRAQLLSEATAQFWLHTVPIVKIGLGIHLLLFILFTFLQIPALAVGNGLSVLVYVACLRAIRDGRFSVAGILMSVEIITHAVLASWVLGWSSNFYMYIYCLVPIVAFSFQSTFRLRLVFNAAIFTVVVGVFALSGWMGIDSGVAPQLLEVFGIVNVMTATAVLLYATKLSVRFARSMQVDLYHTATRDSLTNLYTRRRVLDGVSQLSGSAIPALILLDIDHFKQINDRFGHDRGDVILRRVAEAISTNVRPTEVASRWGGEEFLVLMPDTSEPAAQAVAERILQAIRESAGQTEQPPLTVTATLAVSQIRPGESFESALNRADQALYQGKREGRNQVVMAF